MTYRKHKQCKYEKSHIWHTGNNWCNPPVGIECAPNMKREDINLLIELMETLHTERG